MFSCIKVKRNKLHPCSMISADVFSLLYFKMSLHSQSIFEIPHRGGPVFVGVHVRCSGIMEAGSRRSLGLRPMANSMEVLPLEVACVFLTVAALRINWVRATCARLVWSRFLKAVSTSAKKKSWTVVHPFLLGSAMVYAVLLEFSSRCAFGRMSASREDGGSHICINRLRVHLERVHHS